MIGLKLPPNRKIERPNQNWRFYLNDEVGDDTCNHSSKTKKDFQHTRGSELDLNKNHFYCYIEIRYKTELDSFFLEEERKSFCKSPIEIL